MVSLEKTHPSDLRVGQRLCYMPPSRISSADDYRLVTVTSTVGSKTVYGRFDDEVAEGLPKPAPHRIPMKCLHALDTIKYHKTTTPPTEEDWAVVGFSTGVVAEWVDTGQIGGKDVGHVGMQAALRLKRAYNAFALKTAAYQAEDYGHLPSNILLISDRLGDSLNLTPSYIAIRDVLSHDTWGRDFEIYRNLRRTETDAAGRDTEYTNPAPDTYDEDFDPYDVDDGEAEDAERRADEMEAMESERRAEQRNEMALAFPGEGYPDPFDQREQELERQEFEARAHQAAVQDIPPEYIAAEIASAPEVQLELIPEEPPVGRYDIIALEDLPPDEELPGPAPTKAFVDSVRRFGVLQPVVVRVREVDADVYQYEVVAGRRRIKAARATELEMVPALIYPWEMPYSAVITVVENAQRKPNLVADIRSIQAMMSAGASEEDICRATGLTKGELRTRLPLLNLSDTFMTALEVGDIAPTVGLSIAKLTPTEQASLVPTLVARGKIRAQDVEEVRHISQAQAAAAIPRSMFGAAAEVEPDAQEDATPKDWRERVRAHIIAAYAVVLSEMDPDAPGYRALLDGIDEVQDLINDTTPESEIPREGE